MIERTPCGLGRRLLAIVYDAIVLVAILLIASLPVVLLSDGAHEDSRAWRAALQVYELLLGFAFFGGFWCHGGQTIGMRAWRIRVVDMAGEAIGWRDAAARYIAALLSWACLGLGFLWSLIDAERRTWHDILSHTRLVHERTIE